MFVFEGKMKQVQRPPHNWKHCNPVWRNSQQFWNY